MTTLLFIYWIFFLVFICWGLVATQKLERFSFLAHNKTNWPAVSIIIPARNEERALETALRSILSLDYPAIEIIAVNDRSEDRTGEILERLSKTDSRVKMITIKDLPSQWLGKNHALQTGLEKAQGEYILFTDADIHFEKDALKLAIAYAEEKKLDHLPILFEARGGTFWLRVFEVSFMLHLLAFMQPWLYKTKIPTAVIGVGGFNLFRRERLAQLGGLKTLRLRPDEDWKLGRLMKTSNSRRDCLDGSSKIWLYWYQNLPEALQALEKNLFAAFNYQSWLLILGVIGLLLTYFAPFISYFIFADYKFLSLILPPLFVLVTWASTGFKKEWVLPVCLLPVSALIFAFALLRTMLINKKQGGLKWRGTFYPLSDLQTKIK